VEHQLLMYLLATVEGRRTAMESLLPNYARTQNLLTRSSQTPMLISFSPRLRTRVQEESLLLNLLLPFRQLLIRKESLLMKSKPRLELLRDHFSREPRLIQSNSMTTNLNIQESMQLVDHRQLMLEMVKSLISLSSVIGLMLM